MRILIVKVSSLGDIIHTLPAVTDAAKARKDVVFDWVVEENFVEVPGWHPAVDKVIPVSIRRWRRNFLKTWFKREVRSFRQRLQAEHYDLVIDAQGLIKSGIISRMSKGLTIGLSNQTAREPLSSLFYNQSYSVPWNGHAVDRVRQLFSRALNYRYNKQLVDYGIDISRIGDMGGDMGHPLNMSNDSDNSDTGHPSSMGHPLEKAGGDRAQTPDHSRSVLFLHGTTWASKHWPDAYWRNLGEVAAVAGYQILLPWGDERDRRRAELIAGGNDRATVLEKQTLSGLAQQILKAEGVIAVDTGLGHLAAALGKPALTLYGPTNPDLTGTFGPRQLHLTSNIDCAPCMKKDCAYQGPPVFDSAQDESFRVRPPCFAAHKPNEVWRRFEGLVDGRTAR